MMMLPVSYAGLRFQLTECVSRQKPKHATSCLKVAILWLSIFPSPAFHGGRLPVEQRSRWNSEKKLLYYVHCTDTFAFILPLCCLYDPIINSTEAKDRTRLRTASILTNIGHSLRCFHHCEHDQIQLTIPFLLLSTVSGVAWSSLELLSWLSSTN